MSEAVYSSPRPSSLTSDNTRFTVYSDDQEF
jgi:hypothetical protein